jgi:hypothetical protein
MALSGSAIWRILVFVIFISTRLPSVSATNLEQCFADIQLGIYGSTGGTDDNGNPVANISQATGITYQLCVLACGSGPGIFFWSSFAQQFSAWALPWLALVSQLPFGARFRRDNLMSMLLTIGSPTLAGYSLALTVLNEQWVSRRFDGLDFPNSRYAAKILASLQQIPLKVVSEGSLLASLVVLPENGAWWQEIAERLNYTSPWSFSATFNISWVLIPYIATIISSFTKFSDFTARGSFMMGQSVGALWFWILALVTGWLWVSPKCDFARVKRALTRVNEIAFVATQRGTVEARAASTERAISMQEPYQDSVHSVQEWSPPIFNYARFLPWVQAVEDVRSAFYNASRNAGAHRPVNPAQEWKGARGAEIDPVNRTGSVEHVIAYCKGPGSVRRSRWGPDVLSRMVLASSLGLFLQWGTAGAAIVVAWYAPTRGRYLIFLDLKIFTQGSRFRPWLFFSIPLIVWCCFDHSVDDAYCIKLLGTLFHIGFMDRTTNVLNSCCRTFVSFASAPRKLAGNLQCHLDRCHIHISVQQLLVPMLLWQQCVWAWIQGLSHYYAFRP